MNRVEGRLKESTLAWMDGILAQAQEDATRTREQSKARAQAERDEMLRTARREVAQLAMEAASKVTRKALDSDSDRAILDDFLAEAGEKK